MTREERERFRKRLEERVFAPKHMRRVTLSDDVVLGLLYALDRAEAAAIVAWLREQIALCGEGEDGVNPEWLDSAAALIEAGEHLTTEGDE